jgi:hypothetical protein
MKQKNLNFIISGEIDGRESNAYVEMINNFHFLIDNEMISWDDKVSVKQLYQSLKIASKKQNKAIDEYLEFEK